MTKNVLIKDKILDVPFENQRRQHLFIGAYTISVGDKSEDYLLIYPTLQEEWKEPLPLRLHSACMTSEICGGSRRCDCKWQLDFALNYMLKLNNGLIIYAPSEAGRGQGLTNKVKSFKIMDDKRVGSKEAFIMLGVDPDPRTYVAQAAILKDLGIVRVRLITNNPDKAEAVRKVGIEVVEWIPVVQDDDPKMRAYLEMKAKEFGHKLTRD